MKRIAFLVNNVYVEGVSILSVDEDLGVEYSYITLLVYAQNRLILLCLEKHYYESTDDWAYVSPRIRILENYCVMEDCDNYLNSHLDVEEDYVDNW